MSALSSDKLLGAIRVGVVDFTVGSLLGTGLEMLFSQLPGTPDDGNILQVLVAAFGQLAANIFVTAMYGDFQRRNAPTFQGITLNANDQGGGLGYFMGLLASQPTMILRLHGLRDYTAVHVDQRTFKQTQVRMRQLGLNDNVAAQVVAREGADD